MFTITSQQIDTIIENISGIISDLSPFFLLLLGIFIGVYLLELLVMSINPADREERETEKEYLDTFNK